MTTPTAPPRWPVTIRQLRTEPDLLGNLRAGESRLAWNAFHAAADGLPMTDAEFLIYQQCTGRSDRPARPFATVVAICGRRSGKDSEAIADRAIHRAFFCDRSATLPGEPVVVPVVSADRVQAQGTFNYIAGAIDSSPILAREVVARTAHSLTLRSGVRIEVRTASWRTIRGVTVPFAALNEAAFFRFEEASANADKEILRALRPALATIPDSQTLVASSPYSKRGIVWDLHKRYYGIENSRVLVWKAPSIAMNPTLDPAEIEAAREEDPESARAEWDAEFRDDIADFVGSEIVMSCVIPDRERLPVDERLKARFGGHYAAFTDPSGGSSDSFTLGIKHEEGGKVVVDLLEERRPPFSPDSVVAEFAAVLREFGVRTVTGDAYGASWVSERFERHGIAYVKSPANRSELYLSLLPHLMAGTIELPDHKRLVHQLTSLERRTSRGGRDTIDHPTGAHDDLANVVAGLAAMSRWENENRVTFGKWVV